MISIRNENHVLSLGDLNFFLIDNENEILGYQRTLDDDKVIIILNNKNESAEYELKLNKSLLDVENFEDLIDGSDYTNSNGIINLSLQPYQIMILRES